MTGNGALQRATAEAQFRTYTSCQSELAQNPQALSAERISMPRRIFIRSLSGAG